jgi:hypothetical protein
MDKPTKLIPQPVTIAVPFLKKSILFAKKISIISIVKNPNRATKFVK